MLQKTHKNPVLSDFFSGCPEFVWDFWKRINDQGSLLCGSHGLSPEGTKDDVKRVRCRGPEGTKTSSILILQTLDMICLIYLDVFLYCRDWIYFD